MSEFDVDVLSQPSVAPHQPALMSVAAAGDWKAWARRIARAQCDKLGEAITDATARIIAKERKSLRHELDSRDERLAMLEERIAQLEELATRP